MTDSLSVRECEEPVDQKQGGGIVNNMAQGSYDERYFGSSLGDVDPVVDHIIDLEEERQARKLILIPSESIAPLPVRQALGSVFNNIYAEGYPPLRMTRDEEKLLQDFDHQLCYYRRYADRRFYKGDDYVHFVETLAQRRAASCFANERVAAEDILVNVQPLSGAAANLVVYDAFMEAGDTLMGMDLYQGGHLTHGSEFNVSGKRYRVVSYGVDRSGQLDYEAIMALAVEHRPKVIVAGYTSYPWAPNWDKFREIADEVGALLMADIAHPAGMVVAGYYPSPIGLADVVTFTTHKTICGPRGACILTADEEKARAIDHAVFPGMQGGPHVNKFAAMAVSFGIARTEAFRDLQRRIVENASHLAGALQDRGLGLAYGGTDTHLLMLDLQSIKTHSGNLLYGEPAVRILDLCGIVANKNTIPGDELTALGRGVRLGTPWITQRGMGKQDMEKIAEVITQVLTSIEPYTYIGLTGELPRGKIDQAVLEEAKCKVEELAAGAPAETESRGRGYPHYFFCGESTHSDERGLLLVVGWRAESFLQEVTTNSVAALDTGESQHSLVLSDDGQLISEVFILRLEADGLGRERFILSTDPGAHEPLKAWLRNLSDGYVVFDKDDLFAKVQGPVTVVDLAEAPECAEGLEDAVGSLEKEIADAKLVPEGDGVALYQAGFSDIFQLSNPYFIGQRRFKGFASPAAGRVEWSWQEPEDVPLQRTCLYEEHAKRTRKIIPFAGWEMPVWYTSVSDEHRAVRESVALFDVSHMGVLEIAGPHAASFLDTVCSNYVNGLDDGQSLYGYLLDPDGNVIDDIMVYRRKKDLYMMVVNAANADKDWDWLNAVNDSRVIIDHDDPAKQVEGKAILRNLKDPVEGSRQRADIALQGPNSLLILQSLTDDVKLKRALARMRRTGLIEAELGGLDLIVTRTGYTGEEIGFEIFVHPDQAIELWNLLLDRGQPFGIKLAGLGARDSTRTEAGLPLYGHELAGPFNIDPVAAGFGSYVKLHKPHFIGRKAFIENSLNGSKQIVRFRMNEKGVRIPNLGDPVINRRGKYVGAVTSCAIDSDNFLTGLAYVEKRAAAEGTRLGIFIRPRSGKGTEKQKGDLEPGDTVQLPNWATIVPRFRMRK